MTSAESIQNYLQTVKEGGFLGKYASNVKAIEGKMGSLTIAKNPKVLKIVEGAWKKMT